MTTWVANKTGERVVSHSPADHIPPPRKPVYLPQQADFYRFYSPTTGRSVYLLRGDEAPTVTGGYAKWNTVDRPRRTALTVFSGYDPITMDVPVRFEAYLGQDSGWDIEDDIQTLEYFAGRGVGAANTKKHTTPPYIAIASFGAGGETIHVLGKNYAFDEDENPANMHWLVTGIQWDANVLFNRVGRRIRQTAVVQLTQYVPLRGGKFGAPKKSKPRVVTRKSTAKLNTISKMAKGWGNTIADVRKLNKGNKKLKSYLRHTGKVMPHGTHVKLYVK